MHRMFIALRALLRRLNERDLPPDLMSRLTPCELADLPPFHPRQDGGRGR